MGIRFKPNNYWITLADQDLASFSRDKFSKDSLLSLVRDKDIGLTAGQIKYRQIIIS